MPRSIDRTLRHLASCGALAALLFAAWAAPAGASYYAECLVVADVAMVGPGMVTLTVVEQRDWGGHGQCPIAPGDDFKLAAETLDGQTGRLELVLSYVDSMTPVGVVYSYDWRLAE
jgi:hypothetical protein